MELSVFLLIILGAACHAGWNTVIKLRLEPLAALTLVAAAAGLVSLPLLLWTGLPASASLPYLALSVAIHILYNVALASAYRTGDLGQVYPLARGSAPLLTAIIGTFWLGEHLGALGWAGIGVVVAGVLLLSLKGGRAGAVFDRRAVRFALLTAVMITAYSLADGLGARHAGSPHAYTALLFVLDGIGMILYAALAGSLPQRATLEGNTLTLAAGGALSLISYWIAIYAMTVAPIALVAALRETSVLFGAVFAVVLLGEPLLPVRVAAGCLIVVGAALIRLH